MRASAFELDPATKWLIQLWWNLLPLQANRISRILSMILVDGLYLAVWPRVAAFAPLLSLFLGLLAGWFRFGAVSVFTQSIVILFLVIILGFISSQLGFLFVFGYAILDFFTNPALEYGDPVQMHIALLITYAALIMIAVGLPYFIRLLRVQMLLRVQTSMPTLNMPDTRLVESAFSGIISAFLLFLYLQAVPILIRPLFTWQEYSSPPPVDAVSLIQNQVWLFALIALIVAVLRVIVEHKASVIDHEAIDEFVAPLEQTDQLGFLERLPNYMKLVLVGGTSTLLVAGMLDAWIDGVILFLGLLSIGVVRIFLAMRGGVWSRTMEKIPTILRLLIVLAAAYYFSSLLLANLTWGIAFQPLLWALLISMLIMSIAFPEPIKGFKEAGRVNQQ